MARKHRRGPRRNRLGVFYLQKENPDSAYCRLDKKHELIAHRSDEGIVLDVWNREKPDGPVWSTYFFDAEMTEGAL